jgi:hypothetical protein
MPFEVIIDESGDEEVSMIITSLESEFKRIVSLITGFSKGFTSQFIGVPHVACTLIDQNRNLRSIVTLD